ncbi:MAG TPA: UDP-N-acetylmuramoyl-L-alanine--D-glutamate ligase [Sphingomonas bacterium]|uniref:UDP-N-acetylmuramoylalanine--D-glutamate ligase n=1 Tax=Sphingomonas bacterium TaxID=1895847 RepID=A0A3D0WCT8_9SPHN|nr:UDP-N-acetylmuramoyl-L-alanine--D-glutamate ligase [Sphingomonas bacterium]
MIRSTAWAGKRFAVLGLARSGAATVRALVASGAEVTAWDSDAAKREAIEGAAIRPIEDTDLTGFAGVVVSPGVPLNTHPIAAQAKAAGVPVIGDLELFAQARAEQPAHRAVGITGTNGKSTTTALIHHILETAGVRTLMGGNIGLPILGQAPLPEGGVYVLELSSYQIDLTQTLDCDVAVLLNITPDHLDRYDGFDAYAASKARLFAMQSAGQAAIIGIGDEASAAIAKQVARSGRAEDLTKIAPGVCMDQSRWPALQGPHNAQNALAAIAACGALGVSNAAIDAGLASFEGLPHRTRTVAVKHGVRFVDDSKATNPESVAPALRAFDRVHWILGGVAKSDSLEACRPGFAHVVAAYTIGEAGPLFDRLLGPEAFPVTPCGTLGTAVGAAAQAAKPGETVLLSPACASFDQFADYAARGNAFAALVEKL